MADAPKFLASCTNERKEYSWYATFRLVLVRKITLKTIFMKLEKRNYYFYYFNTECEIMETRYSYAKQFSWFLGFLTFIFVFQLILE